MSRNTLKLSQEEMGRRFDELFAIHNKTETCETIAEKWAARGRPITIRMVRKYYSEVKRRIERGDGLHDLHKLAKNYGWSDIIWKLRPGTE
jgi:hypothetical protein